MNTRMNLASSIDLMGAAAGNEEKKHPPQQMLRSMTLLLLLFQQELPLTEIMSARYWVCWSWMTRRKPNYMRTLLWIGLSPELMFGRLICTHAQLHNTVLWFHPSARSSANLDMDFRRQATCNESTRGSLHPCNRQIFWSYEVLSARVAWSKHTSLTFGLKKEGECRF